MSEWPYSGNGDHSGEFWTCVPKTLPADYVKAGRFRRALRLLVPLLALWVVLALIGCTTARERATADAAASIWEAADAVQKGVPGPLVVPAIKVNAAAIIKAQGLAYPPAGVTP